MFRGTPPLRLIIVLNKPGRCTTHDEIKAIHHRPAIPMKWVG